MNTENTVHIIENRILPPLTIISKGKAVSNNQNIPPLTIISKGKAANSCQIPLKQQLHQAKHVRPVDLVSKQKLKNADLSSGKSSKKGTVKNQPNSTESKTLIVKKYGIVSAPVPFFDQGKASKIPISTATNSYRQQDSVIFNQVPENSIEDAINEYLETEFDQDEQCDPNVIDCVGAENERELIAETADKAVQTDCFCDCISRRDEINVEEIARKISDHLSLSIDETKKKNKMSSMMYTLFPIKTTKNLERIDYNLRNTANFEIRLNLFLKYLKSRTSISIATPFKELVSDEFLKGRNWDGSKGQLSLCTYEFFNVTLFEAWQNSHFTKDIYIDAMKTEIKKAHDRLSQLNQRKRRRGDLDDQEEE